MAKVSTPRRHLGTFGFPPLNVSSMEPLSHTPPVPDMVEMYSDSSRKHPDPDSRASRGVSAVRTPAAPMTSEQGLRIHGFGTLVDHVFFYCVSM